MTGISRRGVLGGLLALAGAKALALPVSGAFAAEPAVAVPTPQQLALIRELAARFDYLVLADTNHDSHRIDLFGYNNQVVKAFSDGGLQRIFMELPPAKGQVLADFQQAAAQGLLPDEQQFMKDCNDQILSDWVAVQEYRDQICGTLAQTAATYPDMPFIACDRRREGPVWEAFLHGKLSTEEYQAMLHDDTNSWNYMQTFPGRSAVYFGAAHFNGTSTTLGHDDNFRRLIPAAGRSLCVVNLFTSEFEKQAYDRRMAALGADHPEFVQTPPDIEFYINLPPGNPSGIVILNPDLAALAKPAIKLDITL